MSEAAEHSSSAHSRNSSLNSVADDIALIEHKLFRSINEGNRDTLTALLCDEDASDGILKVILTTVYSNEDGFYAHDTEVLQDAAALLGSSTRNLNALQIACILGDEDIALELLEFINKITEELESKKLLLEFVGRIWGAGNTVLHLASFFGMADFVKRLLELGANPNKRNERQLRPVDCADDDSTLHVFSTAVLPEAPRVFTRASSSEESVYSINQLKTVTSFEEPFQKSNSTLKMLNSSNVYNLSTTDVTGTDGAGNDLTELEQNGPIHNNLKISLEQLRISEPSLNALGMGESKNALDNIIFHTNALTRRVRKISFDPVCTILYFCQYGEQPDYFTPQGLRDLIKENKSMLNEINTGHQSLTPLHVACAYNQVAVAEFLLKECGVPVNVPDKEGWTPLHSACVEGNAEIVELLCRCQGNLSSTTRNQADWFYVQDGPIDLTPINDDDETPDQVIGEKRTEETKKILKEWIIKYPQTLKVHRRPQRQQEDDSDDSEDDDESATSSDDEGAHSEENNAMKKINDSVYPRDKALKDEDSKNSRDDSLNPSPESDTHKFRNQDALTPRAVQAVAVNTTGSNGVEVLQKKKNTENTQYESDPKKTDLKSNECVQAISNDTKTVDYSSTPESAISEIQCSIEETHIVESGKTEETENFPEKTSSVVENSFSSLSNTLLQIGITPLKADNQTKSNCDSTGNASKIPTVSKPLSTSSTNQATRNHQLQQTQSSVASMTVVFSTASSSVGQLNKSDSVRSHIPKLKSPDSSMSNLLSNTNSKPTGNNVSKTSKPVHHNHNTSEIKPSPQAKPFVGTTNNVRVGSSGSVQSRIMALENNIQKKAL